MKQNLLFNQASALGKRLAMVLTMLLTIGIGTMLGATVTYTVSSTTSVTKSGTAPIDATASYNQTYGTAKQLTKNNSATLTLTNLGGINISNLTLSMKSNSNSGSGKLSYSIDGGSTWTYLVGSSSSGSAFSNANWNGKYTTSYTDISKDVTINNATQLKIKIEATASSLYCESYTITYTDATPKQEYELSYQAGESSGILQVEEGANLLDVLGELGTPTSCDATSTTFVGWTATKITEKTNTAPTFITSTYVMPSSNYAVFAVFAENSGGASFDGTTGGNFKIYAIVNGTKYYAKGTGSKISSTTEESDATEYTFAKTSTGFTIKTGTSYITYSSSTNLGTSTTAYNWDISEGTNGSWRIASVASTSRGIVFRAGSSYNQFGGYALSNVSAGSKEYFDVEIGSSPSYSNFITSCTTQTVPSLSASVSSLAFGNVTVNSSEELEFTLSGSNLTADATLALSGTNANMFSVTPTSVPQSSGSITNETITVTYTPTAKASHSAILTISSTGAESIEIPLSGTGVAQTANYTVKHYQQNITDDNYTLKETQELSGEVGTIVTPDFNSYEGFTAPTEKKSVEITADGNAVVEYQYARNSYTLTWNLDGGTITTAGTPEGAVKYGASLTAPVVEKDGFNFKGWNPSVPNTMPADNATYTAQWKATYTVTFLNHGEEVEKVTVEAGNSVTLPTEELTSCDTEKYPHFYGWTANPIDGVGTTEPADLITENFTPNSSVTLHAVFVDQLPQEGGWQVVTSASELVAGKIYTIGSYGSPDSGVAMGEQKSDNRGTASWTTGTPVELTLGGSTGAWTLYDSSEGGYLYAASSSKNYLKTQITLNENGKWAITISNKKATIEAQGSNSHKYMRYNPNNGSPIFSCYEKSSSQSDISLLTKSMATQPSAYITSCCETEAPTDGSIDGVKGSGNAMSVTLHWQDANDYKRYHVVCDELGIDEYVEEKTDFETNGVLSECTTYIFKVSSAPDGGCESPVLEIEATPFIPKTIDFVDGENTTKQSTTCDSQSITVPTPTAQKCSTHVWIDEVTGTEYTDGQTITPANDMTIVAKWSVETYTITFNNWDGTQLQQSTVECGQTPAYNGETPTREQDAMFEYEFAGWTPTIEEADGNTTYTATYNKTKRTYTVDWYVNGKLVKNETVEAGELATAPDLSKIPCGAVLAGWTDAPNGEYVHETSTLYPGEEPSIEILENKTLYAVFADIDE